MDNEPYEGWIIEILLYQAPMDKEAAFIVNIKSPFYSWVDSQLCNLQVHSFYSYKLLKSVNCMCVEARPPFSNLVTFDTRVIGDTSQLTTG